MDPSKSQIARARCPKIAAVRKPYHFLTGFYQTIPVHSTSSEVFSQPLSSGPVNSPDVIRIARGQATFGQRNPWLAIYWGTTGPTQNSSEWTNLGYLFGLNPFKFGGSILLTHAHGLYGFMWVCLKIGLIFPMK